MNNKNIILLLIAFMLIAIIGGMGYWWYSFGYIKSVKPYTDPYKNYSEAELVKMQEKGDLDATAELGNKAFDKGEYNKAYFLYIKAAEKNNARGQNGLGCYYSHLGKYKESYKWFEESSNQDYVPAIINLAMDYERGEGVKQDYCKAFDLYLKAAEKGHNLAQEEVGTCYLIGQGTTKNGKKAFLWFMKSAEQGNGRAFWRVGRCYTEGIGTTKDETKALELYQKSALTGDMYGQQELGKAYDLGYGGQKIDKKKAFDLYQKSAMQGLSTSQFLLGQCYEYGNGTAKNPKKAFEYCMLSAKQGFDLAQYKIAMFYWYSFGVNRDTNKIYYWAGLAAKQGNKDAKKLLKDLPQWIYAEEQTEKEYGHIGTFEFTDNVGNVWVLVVNTNETATIGIKGRENKAYASWYKYDHMNYAQFTCSGSAPTIFFPSSELMLNDYGYPTTDACGRFCIDGKYIYFNSTAADARNPKLRLPLTKIK